MKNSQQGDEDFLDKLVQAWNTKSSRLYFESKRHQGTDAERAKNSLGTTEYTQRYDCDINGQFDDTWHLYGSKVLELPVMLNGQTMDCSTVCATQLPFKVERTHVCFDKVKFMNNGTNVRKNRTLFGKQQHSNGQEVVILAVQTSFEGTGNTKATSQAEKDTKSDDEHGSPIKHLTDWTGDLLVM
ncbi:hypothetical protein scyTo_0004170 [Scyliorhinus torazame]|uniref:Uncharacterized protein n=1 Tax=Scyliorhinus torazame TaxID=75743 RepID=A0A401NLX9_SCYTO|nr:hypothetical protein [Scyliorhinus torazame]